MKKIIEKKRYSAPYIERLELDNEISLVLQSALPDPGEPGVLSSTSPEYFNNDPFKTNLG